MKSDMLWYEGEKTDTNLAQFLHLWELIKDFCSNLLHFRTAKGHREGNILMPILYD